MFLPRDLFLYIAQYSDNDTLGSLLQLNLRIHDFLSSDYVWENIIIKNHGSQVWMASELMREYIPLRSVYRILQEYKISIVKKGVESFSIKFSNHSAIIS